MIPGFTQPRMAVRPLEAQTSLEEEVALPYPTVVLLIKEKSTSKPIRADASMMMFTTSVLVCIKRLMIMFITSENRSAPPHDTHTHTQVASRERRDAVGPSGPSRPGLTNYIGGLRGLTPQQGARAPFVGRYAVGGGGRRGRYGFFSDKQYLAWQVTPSPDVPPRVFTHGGPLERAAGQSLPPAPFNCRGQLWNTGEGVTRQVPRVSKG